MEATKIIKRQRINYSKQERYISNNNYQKKRKFKI